MCVSLTSTATIRRFGDEYGTLVELSTHLYLGTNVLRVDALNEPGGCDAAISAAVFAAVAPESALSKPVAKPSFIALPNSAKATLSAT
jgi:hypothetical protein